MKNQIITTLILSLSLSFAITAQEMPDTALARQYYQESLESRDKAEFDEAFKKRQESHVPL